MMKRLLAALLAAVLLAGLLPAALADSTAIVHNPKASDRLNLREAPRKDAPSMGKYYNGVEVTVLSGASEEYAKVRVAGRTGYMMTQYLDIGAASGTVASAMPVLVVNNQKNATYLNLRAAPTSKSKSLGTYKNGTQVTVMGVVGSWRHVKVNGKTGFMHADYLSAKSGSASSSGASSSAKTAIVRNPDPKDRLNLRQRATSGSPSLGLYYNGVQVKLLSSAQGDWVKVSVGDRTGYMKRVYLAVGAKTGSVASAMPEMTVTPSAAGRKVHLRKTPSQKAKTLAYYGAGTKVTVLGVLDGWYHVKIGSRTGFMMAQFVK